MHPEVPKTYNFLASFECVSDLLLMQILMLKRSIIKMYTVMFDFAATLLKLYSYLTMFKLDTLALNFYFDDGKAVKGNEY